MDSNTKSISTSLLNAHIMVVDYQLDNLKLVEGVLHSKGYNAISLIQDQTTVIPLYQKQSADLILIDLNMPVMDGFSLIQALKIWRTHFCRQCWC